MFVSKTKPLKMLVKEPGMFVNAYLHWGIKTAITKYTKIVFKPVHYAGKTVMPDQTGNEYIKQKLLTEEPFAVGRPGATEIHMIMQGLWMRNGFRKDVMDEDYQMVYVNSGLFPRTAEAIRNYTPVATEALKSCDLLNVSYCVTEDYVYKKYMGNNANLTYIRALDYWRFENPWTAALAGKRVLVISPFAETIQKQYRQREKLYKDPDILPEFTLYTVKAVQTAGLEKDDRFADWFEALEYMYQEAMLYDFDVAILSCGAYALPLAAKFKAQNRSAIHMGGVAQMLFGIIGRRWALEPGASDFFNEYWVHPSNEETPASAQICENGAYW